MNLKIDMLRCFAAVASSGNLAGAADKLSRTPSAVSMTLKQLEAELGGPLFEPGRKTRLTKLGEFVRDEARAELDHFQRTVASIEAFAQARAGRVRIAAVPSVAEAVLPTAVADFRGSQAAVHLELRDMDSASVVREIERERVDLGLASLPHETTDISREALFSDAFGVVCRTDHPLAEGSEPLDWPSLESWPFLANGICEVIADDCFQAVFASSRLTVHNTTSLLAMVRRGVGVTVLPRLAVDPQRQDVVFRPVADRAARRTIALLRRRHMTSSPAVHRFEQVVRESVRDLRALDAWC